MQQLHRIAVHTFKRSSAKWTPRQLVFGHRNEEDAQDMAERIREMISKDPERPRSLLVGIELTDCLVIVTVYMDSAQLSGLYSEKTSLAYLSVRLSLLLESDVQAL